MRICFKFYHVWLFLLISSLTNSQGIAQPYNIHGYASAKIILSSGEILNTGLDKTFKLPLYLVSQELTGGSKFQIEIENTNYEYIYIIGCDKKNDAGLIFQDNIEKEKFPIIIPSNHSYIRINDTPGKEYITILFSDSTLDVQKLIQDLIVLPESYYENIQKSIGDKLIDSSQLRPVMNKLGFTAFDKSKTVALTFEIDHQ